VSNLTWVMQRCGDLYRELSGVVGKPVAAATMKAYGMIHQADDAGSQEFCCLMRKRFILGIIAESPNVPVPAEVVDFIDFDTLLPDGRQMLRIRYCPFCGSYLKAGQTRVPR
jgi:hypothetical protein